MTFDPKREGIALAEAFMRFCTSTPVSASMLVQWRSTWLELQGRAHANGADVVERTFWLPNFAPRTGIDASEAETEVRSLEELFELEAILAGCLEQEFRSALRSDKLTAWARESSPLAPYQRIDAQSWAFFRVVDYRKGVCEEIEGTGLVWRPSALAGGRRVGREEWRRRPDGLRLYAACIQLAPKPLRVFSKAELRKWYREVWIPQHVAAETIPSAAEDHHAARSAVASTVPRDAIREVRKELAPEHWKQPGRRGYRAGN